MRDGAKPQPLLPTITNTTTYLKSFCEEFSILRFDESFLSFLNH